MQCTWYIQPLVDQMIVLVQDFLGEKIMGIDLGLLANSLACLILQQVHIQELFLFLKGEMEQ